MKFLAVIGSITLILIAIKLWWKMYRNIFPKKYNWNNCPNDHDTMSRSGLNKCDKCNNDL